MDGYEAVGTLLGAWLKDRWDKNKANDQAKGLGVINGYNYDAQKAQQNAPQVATTGPLNTGGLWQQATNSNQDPYAQSMATNAYGQQLVGANMGNGNQDSLFANEHARQIALGATNESPMVANAMQSDQWNTPSAQITNIANALQAQQGQDDAQFANAAQQAQQRVQANLNEPQQQPTQANINPTGLWGMAMQPTVPHTTNSLYQDYLNSKKAFRQY